MNKGIFFTLCLSLLFVVEGWSQEANFQVHVSIDSVLMGNRFKVEFTLENANGNNFSPPEFRDFDIVGGPNQSSSMSFVNGETSQSLSYSYYLSPREVGTFYIEPSAITIGDEILETAPIEINVYPNPDGIQQNPDINRPNNRGFFDNFWFESQPRLKKEKKKEKAKKKRKVYRI